MSDERPVDESESPAGTPPAQRILAPDLARGFALLLVALSHATSIFMARTPGADQHPAGLERPYFLLIFMLVHTCALPLFGMMLGYGLVQFRDHQAALGRSWPEARGILLRRHVLLLVFGVLDGVLLYSGDVLGAYGVVGLIFVALVLPRGAGLYRVGIIYLGFGVVYLTVFLGLVIHGMATMMPGEAAPFPAPPDGSSLASSYGSAVLNRLQEYPITIGLLSSSILFVWVGAWAARRRILEEPEKHLGWLRLGLIGGFGICLATTLPMALRAAGLVQMDRSTAELAKTTYQGGGLFGAVGYVSLFGLIGYAMTVRRRRESDDPGMIATALIALGRRTLSGYLFQAVCWLVLAPAFSLDLGTAARDHSALIAGAAGTGVWILSLVAATIMHRSNYRGPAEILIRRVAYRDRAPNGRPAPQPSSFPR